MANNAILESTACGVPVVVSDVGSVRDYVDSSVGVLVESGSPEAHAFAVLSLLDDRHYLAELGKNCRAHAERRFGWDKTALQISEFIR